MIPIIHLTENIFVPTWILILSFGLSCALVWVNTRAGRWSVSRSQALDLSLYMMFGAIVGGRLLHVLFESPTYYVRHPLDVIFFWQGGFVYFGGLAGALLIGYRWCVRHDQSFWRWGDFFAPLFAATYAVGRVGCFFNGCCYGKICHLPWAISFPAHATFGIEVIPRHPTQIYATLWEIAVLVYVLWREKRPAIVGTLFLKWMFLHAIGRFLMEVFRDDDRGPQILGLSLGMLLSLMLMAISLWQLRERHRPVSI